MWPILVCALVSVAVVGERIFWWWYESRRRDHAALMKIMDALQKGDVEGAGRLAKGSRDPVVQMVDHGLNEHETSLQVAISSAVNGAPRTGRSDNMPTAPMVESAATPLRKRRLSPNADVLWAFSAIDRSSRSVCG